MKLGIAAGAHSSSDVDVRSEENPADWNAFILVHPEATVAHLWPWSAVIQEAYGHRTHHLVARDGSGVAGVLPLVEVRSRIFGSSLCSMPYLDTGGIVASASAAWSGLVAAACDLALGLGIRRLDLRHAGRPRLAVPARRDKVNLVLALGRDEKDLWNGIGAKTRNQVRKAEKAGLTAERAGADGVELFYRVWRVNMRDLGSPAHHRRWFERLFTHFGPRAGLILVRRQGLVIGGLVTLEFRDTMVVPWASSDRRYLSLCPNNLLYWMALREALRRGLARFDFGRSSIGSGTYQFKRQWGAVESPLYWQELDPAGRAGATPLLAAGESPPPIADTPDADPRRERAASLWRRLPVPVATWLGGRLRGGITL